MLRKSFYTRDSIVKLNFKILLLVPIKTKRYAVTSWEVNEAADKLEFSSFNETINFFVFVR